MLTFAFLCKIVNTAHILSLAKSNIRIFTNNMHYTTSFSNNNITSLQKKYCTQNRECQMTTKDKKSKYVNKS